MLEINLPISLHAKVECLDGICGKVSQVIVNPVTQIITHIVVQSSSLKASNQQSDQRLVPFSQIILADPELVQLRCTKANLAAMEPFTETHYAKVEVPNYNITAIQSFELSADPTPLMALPYAVPTITGSVAVEDERIPLGEVNVRRGAVVEATDGQVGHVDEFLLDAATGHLTHLVLRQGHFWGAKDIAIPLKAVQEMVGNLVLLKLDRQAVAALPQIPIHRNY